MGVTLADEELEMHKGSVFVPHQANPHEVTRDFEAALCAYTGAPYAVAVTSCTMALLLAVAWYLRQTPFTVFAAPADDLPKEGMRPGEIRWVSDLPPPRVEALGKFSIEIPKRTYVGVPMSIIHAGGRPTFRDQAWSGAYRLQPLPVWDSARWFTSALYPLITGKDGGMVCVSFHASKTLGDTQGGAILHNSSDADAWLRRARFDGRTEGVAPLDDDFDMLGYHAYLSPDVSARLLWKLHALPKHNDPLPSDDYPDLSKHKAFQ